MKTSIPFRLVVLVAAMMCALGASAAEAYACYTSSNTTLTFYYDNLRSTRPGATFDLNTGDDVPGWADYYNNVTTVVFDSSFANARPTSTHGWFGDMYHLQTITGISHLNTSAVTDMAYMFYYCYSLTSLDLSRFNTSNVKTMSAMFDSCHGMETLDLSNFNTSQVTDMSAMFEFCTNLRSLDVSSFNTASVTDMFAMFYDLESLTSLDVSHFNTDLVTDMSYMFCDCESLASLDVSNFGTSQVTNMALMFGGCRSLTSLDLTKFNTTSVTNMGSMFESCLRLTTVYVSRGWFTRDVAFSTNMFRDCKKLTGGKGTTYNPDYTDKTYARIDGGPTAPGYFTDRSAVLRGDVNDDGHVNISDVTVLIDYLLTGHDSGINPTNANVNLDNEINISDVTALIHFVMSNNWD